jgi:hypothetical protein
MQPKEWLTETAMEMCLDIILTTHDTSDSGVMLEVPQLGRACYDATHPDFHTRVSGYLNRVKRNFQDSPTPIEKLCFPYGDGMHWWCICVSLNNKEILVGDGLNSKLPRSMRPGMNKVFSDQFGIDISRWPEIRVPVQRQRDTFSCGLVTLALIECIYTGDGFDQVVWSPKDPGQHRKDWLTRAIQLHQNTITLSLQERSRVEFMQERDVAPPSNKSANCRNVGKHLRKTEILQLHRQLHR